MLKTLKNRKLILASASARRKKILKDSKIIFKSVIANIDEELILKKYIKLQKGKLASLLALSKALEIYIREEYSSNELIVGFDTIVVYKNKIFGKPKDKLDAIKKLTVLSRKTHEVYTGIGIIDLKNKLIICDYEKTKVKMKTLDKNEIISYVNTGEPMDKAGAYAIQGIGKKFVLNVKGDFYNVVGLPISKFTEILRNLP